MQTYERSYYRAEAATTAAEGTAQPCANCGQAVVPTAGESRAPMCGVCWSLLEGSIRTAESRGFRIG